MFIGITSFTVFQNGEALGGFVSNEPFDYEPEVGPLGHVHIPESKDRIDTYGISPIVVEAVWPVNAQGLRHKGAVTFDRYRTAIKD